MRSSLAILAAGTLLASAPLVQAVRSDNCQLHSKTYGRYDLRPLRKQKDYEVENTNGDIYNINFCGPVKTQVWAVDHPEKIGAYQAGSTSGISLGEWDSDPDVERGLLSFTYSGGSACPKSSANRHTVIQLQCDNSWSSGKLELVHVVDQCGYYFNLKTPYACPLGWTSSIFSSLWSLIWYMFVAGAVAFGGAFVYNRFVLKQRGSEQVPFTNALGFVKDMAIISGIWLLDTLQNLFGKLKSTQNSWDRSRPQNVDYNSWSRNSTNGFQSVPSNTDGKSDLPAPPGILDDDDEDEDARVVLGDEEEMLGAPPTQASNKGPFRDAA